MLQQIKETTDFLKEKINSRPKIGAILGTGLGGLVKEIEIEHSIAYENIPNFPVPTVEGHSGKLIFGETSFNLVKLKFFNALAQAPIFSAN